jgi:hypothetical protein
MAGSKGSPGPRLWRPAQYGETTTKLLDWLADDPKFRRRFTRQVAPNWTRRTREDRYEAIVRFKQLMLRFLCEGEKPTPNALHVLHRRVRWDVITRRAMARDGYTHMVKFHD